MLIVDQITELVIQNFANVVPVMKSYVAVSLSRFRTKLYVEIPNCSSLHFATAQGNLSQLKNKYCVIQQCYTQMLLQCTILTSLLTAYKN